MKNAFKKVIMIMCALMVCIGYVNGSSTTAEAASYGSVKVNIRINHNAGGSSYMKLSVCKTNKEKGVNTVSVKGLHKGFAKYATLNGSSYSSKNNCYIRVEYFNAVKGTQVKYIKVKPNDFKNKKSFNVNVSSTGKLS